MDTRINEVIVQIYDMVNGTNTSGFGWDSIKQQIIADKPVWDEYVKVHRKAAPFRTKSFDHYEPLCIVWAKDKTTRKDAQAANDAVEEDQQVSLEDGTENVASPSLQAENETEDRVYSDFPTTLRSDATSVRKKRRRRHVEKDEPSMTHALKEILHEATVNLCTEVRRLAHEANMDDIARTLFEDLLKVPGLTSDEILEAHDKISTNNRMLVIFPTIPDHLKADWIRKRIK